MVVGNNLDAEDAFTERIKNGKAHGDPCPGADRMKFWEGLYRLLDRAQIDRKELFATNVHPALIPGKDPRGSVRRTPAFQDWQRRSSLFLRLQIREMRPRVIVAFGNDARVEVAASLALDPPAVPGMVPITLEGHRAVFVVLRHPSAAQSHDAFAVTVETLQDAWRS